MTELTFDMTPNRDELRIARRDGTHLLTQRAHSNRRPSIHPIMAPDGIGILTQDSPGHHPWQHGLYTGFNRVNEVGFWKEQPEDGSFHPQIVNDPTTAGHAVRWEVQAQWRMPDGSAALDETQHWRLHDFGETFELDLLWELQARMEVTIGEYMAGGFFLRMPFTAERDGLAVNSRGQRNQEAERERARWVAVTMPISVRTDWAGMVMMDHPGNPEHPVTWRVDNELGISPSRCIAGSWSIPAGDVDRYAYRVAVFTGALDQEWIEARWDDFNMSTSLNRLSRSW